MFKKVFNGLTIVHNDVKCMFVCCLLDSHDCDDIASNCAALKKLGKCYTDPVYMIMKCANTCGMCFIRKRK